MYARACPNRPWGPPSLLYNGYRVFPGGKLRPGRADDHSPPSSAEVVEEKRYNSIHPLGHTGPVTGLLYLLHFFICLPIVMSGSGSRPASWSAGTGGFLPTGKVFRGMDQTTHPIYGSISGITSPLSQTSLGCAQEQTIRSRSYLRYGLLLQTQLLQTVHTNCLYTFFLISRF
jgi:hypothetical protein